VLGQWPTGVTVVTTLVDGQWYGVTASSFSSVSLDPPLVSVCLARSAYAHDLVRDSGIFGVTILAKDQADVGQQFARYDPDAPDRFASAPWQTAKTGVPVLGSSLGWLDCSVVHAHDGGDHTIFVGEVLDAATPRTTSPLLYHSRTWGQFADQLPDEVALVADEPGDLRVPVGSVDAALGALMSAADVHARPRVLLTGAFSADVATLGTAVAALARCAPAEIVLVDDGDATPVQVREACREAVMQARPVPVGVRLSDAGGLGQANLLTALKSGVSRLAVGPGALPADGVSLLVTSLGLRLQGAF
jgi:flavin reductase (DIM6/NTAB) family NADH-FMN oxidoreductase RutF